MDLLKHYAEAVLQLWLRGKYAAYWIMSTILYSILFNDGIFYLCCKGREQKHSSKKYDCPSAELPLVAYVKMD